MQRLSSDLTQFSIRKRDIYYPYQEERYDITVVKGYTAVWVNHQRQCRNDKSVAADGCSWPKLRVQCRVVAIFFNQKLHQIHLMSIDAIHKSSLNVVQD